MEQCWWLGWASVAVAMTCSELCTLHRNLETIKQKHIGGENKLFVRIFMRSSRHSDKQLGYTRALKANSMRVVWWMVLRNACIYMSNERKHWTKDVCRAAIDPISRYNLIRISNFPASLAVVGAAPPRNVRPWKRISNGCGVCVRRTVRKMHETH